MIYATTLITLLICYLTTANAQHKDQWTIAGSYDIVSTEPLEIGSQRQLLMDNHVVEDVRACRRRVHQPQKHPKNPLFSSGGLNPDWTFPYTSILRDPDSGTYRLWTASNVMIQTPDPPGFYWLSRGRYYESPNGLDWKAPNLDLVEIDGNRTNNVFIGSPQITYDSVGVTRTPPRWRDKGRYMMIYNKSPAGRDPHPELIAGGQELRIAFSEDGLKWVDQKENPIFRGQSDTANNVTYNPEKDVMMYYRRPPINAGEIRRIAYSESSDLVRWSQPEQIIVPDELDPYSLYCMPVIRYQGVYFGFLHMFYSQPPLQPEFEHGKKGKVDVQLAWSRDGKYWQRHPERPLFLKTGPQGSYDQGRIYVAKGIIENKDNLYIYYTGHESLHISKMVQPGDNHLCLATIRRDGFVSLEAPAKGTVLTRPIKYPGGKLHINARTAKGGSIRAALQRGDGEFDGLSLSKWEYDNCRAFTGDATDYTMSWDSDVDLSQMLGRTIRLEFSLEKAELFSFWFK